MKKTPVFKTGYVILKEKHLIIEVFDGALNLENYKSHRLTQSLDVDFSPNYNLFVDLRLVTVTGTLQDVKAYVDYVIEIGNRIGRRNTAILVSTPNQKIYAHELSQLKGLLHDLKIFTHMEPAVKWVSNDISVKEVEEIILKLRKNPPFVFYSDSEF